MGCWELLLTRGYRGSSLFTTAIWTRPLRKARNERRCEVATVARKPGGPPNCCRCKRGGKGGFAPRSWLIFLFPVLFGI